MIPEILRYKIPVAQSVAFTTAYRQAAEVLRDSPHCLGCELLRSDKDPENYLLTIYWDSAEGHMQGFRTSAVFPPFLALVRPFLANIQEMEHYHPSGIAWRR